MHLFEDLDGAPWPEPTQELARQLLAISAEGAEDVVQLLISAVESDVMGHVRSVIQQEADAATDKLRNSPPPGASAGVISARTNAVVDLAERIERALR